MTRVATVVLDELPQPQLPVLSAPDARHLDLDLGCSASDVDDDGFADTVADCLAEETTSAEAFDLTLTREDKKHS